MGKSKKEIGALIDPELFYPDSFDFRISERLYTKREMAAKLGLDETTVLRNRHFFKTVKIGDQVYFADHIFPAIHLRKFEPRVAVAYQYWIGTTMCARILNVAMDTLQRAVKLGNIHYVKVGGRTRFCLFDIAEYMRRSAMCDRSARKGKPHPLQKHAVDLALVIERQKKAEGTAAVKKIRKRKPQRLLDR